MKDEMAGQREAFLKGYDQALRDVSDKIASRFKYEPGFAPSIYRSIKTDIDGLKSK